MNRFLEKLKNGIVPPNSEISMFLNKLATILGFMVTSETSDSAFSCILMDTSSVVLRVGTSMPVFFLKIAQNSADQLGALRQLNDFLVFNHLEKNIGLVITYDAHPSWARFSKTSVFSLVPIDLTTIEKLIVASNPRHYLFEVIKGVLGFARLIPYQYTGPVHRNMFFGRENELAEIRSSYSNFALFGHRQSGKTSLMMRAMEELERMGYQTVYFDFWNINNYEKFFERITLRFIPLRARRTTRENFSYALKLIGKQNKGRNVLCLDEIDCLLESDSTENFWLFDTLHEACSNSWCRIIVAGYRELVKHISEHGKPLRTLLKPMHVSVLDAKSAVELILQPFRSLGIESFEEDALQHILRMTGRAPAFMQFYCSELAASIQALRKKRITMDDIYQLENAGEYANYVNQIFLVNTVAPERLIVYVMLEMVPDPGDHEYEVSSVHRKLRALGWNLSLPQFDTHLTHLNYLSILTLKGDSFKFSLPAIPAVLKATLDIHYRIHAGLREVIPNVRADMV